METKLKELPGQPLKQESLRALAFKGSVRRYARGAIIIREGDIGDEFFIILSGSVQAYSRDDSGREVIFSNQSAGEYFGEMALDGGPRSASVKALEATACSVLTCRTLQSHFAEFPDFAAELISRLIHRIRVLTQTTRGLALLGVYRRMSDLFERLAVPDANGARVIPERLTHQKIAAYVGASREMVSKVLKELVTGGYLTTRDGKFVIVKSLPPGW